MRCDTGETTPGGFLDDSQTVSLQRQVDNQREVMEENQKEVRGQGSHYRFSAEGFPLMAISGFSFMVSRSTRDRMKKAEFIIIVFGGGGSGNFMADVISSVWLM